MSIEAINEQLLRAIGVGVALVDLRSLTISFRNDTFVEWFGDGDGEICLGEIFPTLHIDALRKSLSDSGRFTAEVSFKVRRRTMTIALDCNRAVGADANIAVLVCQNISRIKELEAMIDSYSLMVERNTLAIRREKEQVEKLLLNVMPRSAYEEYKTFGVVAPRLFEPVSVLALDFAGFDALLAAHEAGVIVSELNDIYTAFDRIGEQFGCERIRTNGDSYIAVAGVPDPVSDHAQAIASAAVRFLRYLRQRNESHPVQWNMRIGVASGPVIGSVVGHQKYIYDVFGPAVSQAIELRDATRGMTISTDEQTASILGDGFELESLPATEKATPTVRLAEETETAARGRA
jgi:adenylate cyclase